jgi:FlaA1/EpsC-like NDP-sugar epimerase
MSDLASIRCLILGGGGHARVVIDSLRMSNACVPEAILEADPEMWGKELDGVPILGDDNLMDRWHGG